MRVCLVVETFPRLSETFIVEKVLGLLDDGVDVHVVCRTFHADVWDRYPALASHPQTRRRVHRLPSRRTGMSSYVLALLTLVMGCLRAPRRAIRLLRTRARFRDLLLDGWVLRLQPDVVHYEYGTLARGRASLARAAGARVSVSFRGADANYVGLADPDFYRDVWEAVDAVHCVSEDVWRRVRRRGCPGDMPRAVIPAAIDTTFFTPGERTVDDGPLRVLSVARLHWKKGAEWGLAAVRDVRDRGVVDLRYRIVGGGPYEEAVAACADDLGLGDVVELLGPVTREDVRRELLETDIFLHPAVSEGFANVCLEAQAMQVPVVCTDADGLPENVADGVTGYVVPRRDPSALADALMDLAGDPSGRDRMGRAGRDRVLEHFTVQRQTAAWRAFYDQMCGG